MPVRRTTNTSARRVTRHEAMADLDRLLSRATSSGVAHVLPFRNATARCPQCGSATAMDDEAHVLLTPGDVRVHVHERCTSPSCEWSMVRALRTVVVRRTA